MKTGKKNANAPPYETELEPLYPCAEEENCTRNAAGCMFYTVTTVQSAFMHSLNASSLLEPTSGVVTQIRCKVRNNFPRPKETKRIKVHGWRTRMSTAEGRKILMRRILKGKHVLSH